MEVPAVAGAPDLPEPEVSQDDIDSMIDDQAEGKFAKHAAVLVYINSGFLLFLAFYVGMYVQKIGDLTAQVGRMQSVEVMAQRIDYLAQEVSRLRDEVDRLSRGIAAGAGVGRK